MIYGDETHGQVNHAKGHNKPVKGYFWTYRSGKFEKIQLVIYDYQNGRGTQYPQEFLKGFKAIATVTDMRRMTALRDLSRLAAGRICADIFSKLSRCRTIRMISQLLQDMGF